MSDPGRDDLDDPGELARPTVTPIERLGFDAAALVGQHPPVWRDPNKQVLYGIACPAGAAHAGRIGFTRWEAMALPARLERTTTRTPTQALTPTPERTPTPAPEPSQTRADPDLVLARAGFYDYAPVLDPDKAVEWHVNFADPRLFVAYGGSLFAQDEMQVAVHPAMGALKEALDATGVRSTTLDRDGPTPVLVTGVERRISIATDRDPTAGRPDGLYGNFFRRADPETVRRATTRIDPPTISNLVAMSAPPGGYGRYREDTIESILVTAYTGFGAAVIESRRLRGEGTGVAIHTGYWGCGAFGGNRVLMLALQMVAAEMAGLDRVVFHTGSPGGAAPLEEATGALQGLGGGGPIETRALLEELARMGFEWGISDGN